MMAKEDFGGRDQPCCLPIGSRRSVLMISNRTTSHLGSHVPEPLLMFTSTCLLTTRISQGLGPCFQIELWASFVRRPGFALPGLEARPLPVRGDVPRGTEDLPARSGPRGCSYGRHRSRSWPCQRRPLQTSMRSGTPCIHLRARSRWP
jgi:hypothetical protein